MAENVGRFEGTVELQWLDDGRRMKLLKDFAFQDPGGARWLAPKGSVVDGASIPRAFWTIIGGPFEGKYRNASIIHDVACVEKTRPWEWVHLCFYYAMRAGGVGKIQSSVMYAAVHHFGPRWTTRLELEPGSKKGMVALSTLPAGERGGFRRPFTEVDATRELGPLLRSQPERLEALEAAPAERLTLTLPATRRTLSQSDFEALQKAIEASEGELSLEEIRAFQPAS